MLCSCGHEMVVTHGYAAGNDASTQRRYCPHCKRTYTSVTVIVIEDPGYGEGARSAKLRAKVSESVPDIKQLVRALLSNSYKRTQS